MVPVDHRAKIFVTLEATTGWLVLGLLRVVRVAVEMEGDGLKRCILIRGNWHLRKENFLGKETVALLSDG